MVRTFVPRRIPRPARSARTWLLLLGVTAVGLAARAVDPSPAGARLLGFELPGCPMKALTGLPCPFCGLTSGTAYLARGAFGEACSSSVLAPLFGAGVLVVALYTLLGRLLAGYALDLAGAKRRSVWITSGALALLSWVVNLCRHFTAR